jgi:hypothetical protein
MTTLCPNRNQIPDSSLVLKSREGQIFERKAVPPIYPKGCLEVHASRRDSLFSVRLKTASSPTLTSVYLPGDRLPDSLVVEDASGMLRVTLARSLRNPMTCLLQPARCRSVTVFWRIRHIHSHNRAKYPKLLTLVWSLETRAVIEPAHKGFADLE